MVFVFLGFLWVPDVELYNNAQSIYNSFTPYNAIVNSDGQVYWARTGSMTVLCKYAGLSDFPFDALQCVLEIAGWQYDGKQQGLVAFDMPGSCTAPGVEWPEDPECDDNPLETDLEKILAKTRGSSYTTYRIHTVRVETINPYKTLIKPI